MWGPGAPLAGLFEGFAGFLPRRTLALSANRFELIVAAPWQASG
jgi:hypothetical protein